VAQLLPANSSDPTALSLAALQGATLVQINGSSAVLALAKSAGFSSVQAFMPGLQMFWDDVSAALSSMFASSWLRAAVAASFQCSPARLYPCHVVGESAHWQGQAGLCTPLCGSTPTIAWHYVTRRQLCPDGDPDGGMVCICTWLQMTNVLANYFM
jgi:hypothetical protein